MGPCAKCIVRAGCTQDCKELEAYIAISSQIATFLAVLLTGIVALVIMLLTNFMDHPTEGASIISTVVWGVCAIINVCINIKNDEKMNEMMIILFSPMFTSLFFFLYIMGYFVKKSMRQKRA